MFEKIVVPLDRSVSSEKVLPYIEEIAGKFNSEITLVGVAEAEPVGEDVSSRPPTVDRGDILRLYLSYVMKQVIKEGKDYWMTDSSKVSYKLLTGDVAKEILRFAEETITGLIALTSHGSSNDESWKLGHISAKILQAAKQPILLVRAEAYKTALDQKKLIRKILLPLDGSKLGEAALPYAVELAVKLSAQLVLVHIVEPMVKWGIYDSNPANKPMDNLEGRKADAGAYLANVGNSLKEQGGLSASSVILFGLPARQIVEYAEENDIDLIGMSTHGRTGIGRWVFDSVTDKVLQAGNIPVLVIRPTD